MPMLHSSIVIPDSPLRVVWEDDALLQLESRDRYTRAAIREAFKAAGSDFSSNRTRSIEIDPTEQEFITPVAKDRYVVVWRHLPDNTAMERGVVPLTHIPSAQDLQDETQRTQFRDYVLKAVKQFR